MGSIAEKLQAIRSENESVFEKKPHLTRDLQRDFPHPWLYVGELLQNAVDANARRISIKVDKKKKALVFEHDGDKFTELDVKALCDKGMSTKGAATVGFMGVGFKAVFRCFERVEVSSGQWRFFLEAGITRGSKYKEVRRNWLGCFLPREDTDIEKPSEGMTCRFVLSKRLPKLESIDNDVERVLGGNLDVLPLLARKGVESLEWNRMRWALSQEEATDGRKNKGIVFLDAIQDWTEEKRRWVLFFTKYQPSDEAIRRFLTHRELNPSKGEEEQYYRDAGKERLVEGFIPLTEDGLPCPPQYGNIYALLRTDVHVPIGMNLQADWLLLTSRQELMEPHENPWHFEIFNQVPMLIRMYLEWACGLKETSVELLPRIYSVLPDMSSVEEDSWVRTAEFKKRLSRALHGLKFVPSLGPKGIRFCSLSESRILPDELREMDSEEYRPWDLFCCPTSKADLLGQRAVHCLVEMNILDTVTPLQLLAAWDTGAISNWKKKLKEAGDFAHVKLIECLDRLDSDEDWKNAPLRCLESESGTWISRGEAQRLPAEWDTVPEDNPAIRSWLRPFLSPEGTALKWALDRALCSRGFREPYIRHLPRVSLESALSAWWESIKRVDNDMAGCIVDMTIWIKDKLPNRERLVMKVLCGTNKPEVVGWDRAFVGEPYAPRSRKVLFKNRKPISASYLERNPSGAATGWAQFFVKASEEKVAGPLRFETHHELVQNKDLGKLLPGQTLPKMRKSGMVSTYKAKDINIRMNPWESLLEDYRFPDPVQELLQNEIDRETAIALSDYLSEKAVDLALSNVQRLIYVPADKHDPREMPTIKDATWLETLKGTAWIPVMDGSGPHLPSVVLPEPDEMLEQEPVADMPESLVNELRRCGIAFGTAVAGVSPIARLRTQGSRIRPEYLLELLIDAVEEAVSSEEKRDELLDILMSVPVFPVSELGTIDNVERIPLSRIVRTATRGMKLGGWLVALDDLSDDTLLENAVGTVALISEIQPAPTHKHALDFLKWVWNKEPEAERVRHILPRAYEIVLEAMNENQITSEQLLQESRTAKVYSGRQWFPVHAEDLFLDDILEDRFTSGLGGVHLATPGHLGESNEHAVQVAEMIGLNRLSEKYEIELRIEGKEDSPSRMQEGLRSIIRHMMNKQKRIDQFEEEVADKPYFRDDSASLYECEQLEKVVKIDGKPKTGWRVSAAFVDNAFYVCGEPVDFMADLCTLLLRANGLNNRRDLDSLAPEITQLIAYLDVEEELDEQLAVLAGSSGVPEEDAMDEREKTEEQEPGEVQDGSKKKPPVSTDKKSTGGTGDYSAERRERKLKSALKKVRQYLATAPLPFVEDDTDKSDREFGSDARFRAAVMAYEEEQGRYPVEGDFGQPGYDIESYTGPQEDPERHLIRRIEIKGRSSAWESEQTVELTNRQFNAARNLEGTEDLSLHDDFDYWLYVVETTDHDIYCVLPVRNPCRAAGKYEFRGGTWRELAEDSSDVKGDEDLS